MESDITRYLWPLERAAETYVLIDGLYASFWSVGFVMLRFCAKKKETVTLFVRVRVRSDVLTHQCLTIIVHSPISSQFVLFSVFDGSPHRGCFGGWGPS